MPRKSKYKRYVKPDYHSQNKQNNQNDDIIKKKRKLRTSHDVYKRILYDPQLGVDLNFITIGYEDTEDTAEMKITEWTMIKYGGDIPMHRILYFKLYLKNKQEIILWDKKTKLDRIYCSGLTQKNQSLKLLLQSINTSNIPIAKPQNINYNKYNNQQPINKKFQKQKRYQKRWKRVSKSQKLQQTRSPHRVIQILDELINIFDNKQNDDNNETKNDTIDTDGFGLCKFYGAGYCFYGSKCRSSHNADKLNKYEQEWLNCKTIIDGKQLFPIRIPPKCAFSKQKYDYLLVLDLEGKVEIIELPIIMIDLNKMCEISRFHAWIRPIGWDKNNYIPNDKKNDINYCNDKSKAISWPKALDLLNKWLLKYEIYLDKNGKYIDFKNQKSKTFLISICGNWDVKTQIPKQCDICNIPLPYYFNKWMNIKDFALIIYPYFKAKNITGMAKLLIKLNMELFGTHHLGMDDTYNIARIVIQYAIDNAVFDYTAERDAVTKQVTYQNKNKRAGRGSYYTRRK